MANIDEQKLNELVGKMLGDLGGAFSVPTTRIGYDLGLFDALANHGPATAKELAAHTALNPRNIREWALAQAANGYIDYAADTDRFSLSEEQAMVFTVKDSPVYLKGAFDLAASMIDGQDKVAASFRTGNGVKWGDSSGCLFCAVGAFFRPGYVNSIVQQWLPALNGIEGKLTEGARVADVGCGVGFSTLLMAQAFPNSRFVGYDFHEPSILEARKHAQNHGVSERVSFEACDAKDIKQDGFDLVTMFDCLHDLGDPAGTAAHVRSILKPGACAMIVEPIAGDQPSDNMNPIGRLYYNGSAMICVPTSLAQDVGAALGAQAGEAAISQLLSDSGFTSVRRATEGPFNMVLEAVNG